LRTRAEALASEIKAKDDKIAQLQAEAMDSQSTMYDALLFHMF